ncbi:MAG: BON domain-containing protein [Gammaproteobacteria bacterium]
MKKIIVFLICCLTLQACVSVGKPKHTSHTKPLKKYTAFQNFYHDTDITNQAFRRFKTDPNLKNTRLLAATKNQKVLLVGQVTSPQQRTEAEELVRGIPGVLHVYNDIKISGATSPLTQSSDSWITTKIKSQLAVVKNLPSRKIKVVTENGTVYLMGTITPSQADTTVNIARRVAGVQKVVKLLDYV